MSYADELKARIDLLKQLTAELKADNDRAERIVTEPSAAEQEEMGLNVMASVRLEDLEDELCGPYEDNPRKPWFNDSFDGGRDD